MIEYRIDQKSNNTATSHIRDMDAVLSEISNTYEIILDVVKQQENALSSPTINNFRKDLKTMISQAIELSDEIVSNSRKLVVISDQASKQLLAIEDHFSTTLEKHSNKANRGYKVQ